MENLNKLPYDMKNQHYDDIDYISFCLTSNQLYDFCLKDGKELNKFVSLLYNNKSIENITTEQYDIIYRLIKENRVNDKIKLYLCNELIKHKTVDFMTLLNDDLIKFIVEYKNDIYFDNWTIIMQYAIKFNHLDIVKILIEKGFDPNWTFECVGEERITFLGTYLGEEKVKKIKFKTMTPLELLVNYNSFDLEEKGSRYKMFEYLIDSGADIFVYSNIDVKGYTILNIAKRGGFEYLEKIVSMTDNPNLYGTDRCPILVDVFHYDRKFSIKYLLSHPKIEINWTNEKELIFKFLLKINGYVYPKLYWIIKHPKFNASLRDTVSGLTPIQMYLKAFVMQYYDMFEEEEESNPYSEYIIFNKYLIQKGADINDLNDIDYIYNNDYFAQSSEDDEDDKNLMESLRNSLFESLSNSYTEK